ncbi:hypothetical protein ZWY2020_001960 [Hordeum vulgare]|nr:hypothetical protein ZWY2020_001960 [Hordeum vulgare]
MANFPVDPNRFAPAGMMVEEPWDADERPPRIYVTATQIPLKRHEAWAIAQLEPRPPAAEIDQLLEQIAQHIVDHVRLEVISRSGAVSFGRPGDNFRSTTYTRQGWIMLLNLPMDYRNDDFLREVVSKFGKMRSWFHEDFSPTRTLIKCAYGAARDIPRSIVVREPQRLGGVVLSWTVPVYILASDPIDILPGDESPEPHNGNPHPMHAPEPGEQVNDNNDADIPHNNNAQDDQGWENWDEEAATDNEGHGGWDDAQQPQDDQHQSSMTVQFSEGSVDSVQFVQEEGPVQLVNLEQNQVFRVLLPDPLTAWAEYFQSNKARILFGKVDGCITNMNLDYSFASLVKSTSVSVIGTFSVAPISPSPKKRPREKKDIVLVNSDVRRSTRSLVRKQGFKLVPMTDTPEPRKKPRSAKPRAGDGEHVTPETPIKVMQEVGKLLEIAEEELTEGKLTAAPSKPTSPASSDD